MSACRIESRTRATSPKRDGPSSPPAWRWSARTPRSTPTTSGAQESPFAERPPWRATRGMDEPTVAVATRGVRQRASGRGDYPKTRSARLPDPRRRRGRGGQVRGDALPRLGRPSRLRPSVLAFSRIERGLERAARGAGSRRGVRPGAAPRIGEGRPDRRRPIRVPEGRTRGYFSFRPAPWCTRCWAPSVKASNRPKATASWSFPSKASVGSPEGVSPTSGAALV